MNRLLALALLLAACKPDVVATPDPVRLTEEAVSHFCQMNVMEHGGPKAQIHLRGLPTPLFFAQVRDAVAYLKGPERDADVIAAYVSDMAEATSWALPGEDNWINAREAVFVVASGVRGGMGAPEIVPFRDAAAAQAFIDRYGGTAQSLDQIPVEAALAPVDLDQPLKEPSWPLN